VNMLDSVQKFQKDFKNWFLQKPKIDRLNSQPPFVDIGQIWWCYAGENIGSEISGKGVNFARPCVIYKKLSRYNFMIAPCSTKIKEGSWFVQFTHNKILQVAVLSQVKIIDYRRLKNKMGELDSIDFEKIISGFEFLYSHKLPKNKSLIE
jgi:mRNA interferase MazF